MLFRKKSVDFGLLVFSDRSPSHNDLGIRKCSIFDLSELSVQYVRYSNFFVFVGC